MTAVNTTERKQV